MNYKRKRDAKARAELPVSETIDAEKEIPVSETVKEEEVAEDVQHIAEKAPVSAPKRKRNRNTR